MTQGPMRIPSLLGLRLEGILHQRTLDPDYQVQFLDDDDDDDDDGDDAKTRPSTM